MESCSSQWEWLRRCKLAPQLSDHPGHPRLIRDSETLASQMGNLEVSPKDGLQSQLVLPESRYFVLSREEAHKDVAGLDRRC